MSAYGSGDGNDNPIPPRKTTGWMAATQRGMAREAEEKRIKEESLQRRNAEAAAIAAAASQSQRASWSQQGNFNEAARPDNRRNYAISAGNRDDGGKTQETARRSSGQGDRVVDPEDLERLKSVSRRDPSYGGG